MATRGIAWWTAVLPRHMPLKNPYGFADADVEELIATRNW